MSDLPPGWRQSTLGDLGQYVNGRGFKKSEWTTSGRPIIRIQNLTGTSSTFNYFDGEVEDRYVVRPGDLLVSWAATLGAHLWPGPEAVLNQHIFRVGSKIDKRFHKYLLDFKLSELMRHTHGSGMVHITRSRFDSVPVAIPPDDEQRRIVEVLEDHLSHLDAAEAALDLSWRRLTAFEAAALAEVHRATDHLVSLAEVSEVQGGIQKQPKRAPQHNAFPFLRVANVMPRGLDLVDVHKIELFDGELQRYRLEPGDLLVVEGNGSPSQVGRAAMWEGSISDCVHQNHLIRVRPLPSLQPAYLEVIWNSSQNRRQLTAVASSTSGLHTLSVAKLKSLRLPLPSVEVQAALSGRVAELREQRSHAMQAIALSRTRLSSLRRALLQAAFSGRLTGQSSGLDTAEELSDVVQRSSVTPA